MTQCVFDRKIGPLIIDSRKAIYSKESLFFAIKGERHDGHNYIKVLYDSGIRQFVVEDKINYSPYPEANFVEVHSSIDALQSITTNHRSKFSFPVIGITGSHAKTTVKEWLYQLLVADYNCVKSPGSYNSQVGTPLSLWLMNDQHELGIFEAGSSKTLEMRQQQKMIQPTIGLITNIEVAQNENFISEKIHLFHDAKTIIYNNDSLPIRKSIASLNKNNVSMLGWGQREDSAVRVQFEGSSKACFSGYFGNFSLILPFTDKTSRENTLHCILVLLHLKYSPHKIQKKINCLSSIPIRLELKLGINRCRLIDDTYNNDIDGLQISLDFLDNISTHDKTIILSDMLPSGQPPKVLFSHVAELIKAKNISKIIGIGQDFYAHQDCFKELSIVKQFYPSTKSFIEQIDWDKFHNETILIKGNRDFKFEKIIHHLQKKIHSTVMEVNLDAIVHNLNFFKALLQPNVKFMVMVKAFAYGSSSSEISRVLQYHQIDYLGVAHVDEGVTLRRDGIKIPIMVMNPIEESFNALVKYNLEPEIHTLLLLRLLVDYLKGETCRIHLKIDTGMHRLGLQEKDIPEINTILKTAPNVSVVSIFSHLAAADEPKHDQFSIEQANQLQTIATQLAKQLHPPLRHILNSCGILRFPQLQWDMVRLGIGLYGVDPTGTIQDKLEVAITLKTTVLQVKKIPWGETVGYGRRGISNKAIIIATIAIGYADGFSRNYSEGKGEVLIRGKKASVVGKVCMDMTMVDVTSINGVQEGDEVTIFGEQLPIQHIATKIDAIPYEILTGIGGRVKRIFHAESI